MAAGGTVGGLPTIPRSTNLAESQQTKLRTTSMSMTVLAAVFVTLRFCSRIKLGRVGADDYMLLVSLVGLPAILVVRSSSIDRRRLDEYSCGFA